MAHQRLGHAVLFPNIAEVSGAAGLKPDVIPKLGVVLPTITHGALCCQYVMGLTIPVFIVSTDQKRLKRTKGA